jgi:hypothetical protein
VSEQGKGAMEYVLKTAMMVAAMFVVTDFDDLQRYLVVGSEVRLQQSWKNMSSMPFHTQLTVHIVS